MKGDRSLRLTGIYIWLGQLIPVTIAVAIHDTLNSMFWILNSAIFLTGLIIFLIPNWKHWFPPKPLWERNKLQFMLKCTQRELFEYMDAHEFKDSKEIDFTRPKDSHWCNITSILNNALISQLHGHCSFKPKIGDTCLIVSTGGTVIRLMIIDLTFPYDNDKAFFAYACLAGDKQEHITTKDLRDIDNE